MVVHNVNVINAAELHLNMIKVVTFKCNVYLTTKKEKRTDKQHAQGSEHLLGAEEAVALEMVKIRESRAVAEHGPQGAVVTALLTGPK